jgi:hypothetical protein
VKKSSFFAGCVAVASLALSGSVLAHHGDAGRYIEEVVEITGTVVETQLINPHAILVLDVTDPNGKKVRWQAEMGGAQGLIRGGWTTDVKPGTKVTLTGRRLKSGAPYMNLTERARVVVTDTGKEVLRNANFGQPAPTGGGGTSNTGGAAAPAAPAAPAK